MVLPECIWEQNVPLQIYFKYLCIKMEGVFCSFLQSPCHSWMHYSRSIVYFLHYFAIRNQLCMLIDYFVQLRNFMDHLTHSRQPTSGSGHGSQFQPQSAQPRPNPVRNPNWDCPSPVYVSRLCWFLSWYLDRSLMPPLPTAGPRLSSHRSKLRTNYELVSLRGE